MSSEGARKAVYDNIKNQYTTQESLYYAAESAEFRREIWSAAVSEASCRDCIPRKNPVFLSARKVYFECSKLALQPG
ncbi:MAG: hypothetical protein NUW37_09115 [Planctomycetes bacterium]|nr:hypothetical protein [Planctomycetota bacterium]